MMRNKKIIYPILTTVLVLFLLLMLVRVHGSWIIGVASLILFILIFTMIIFIRNTHKHRMESSYEYASKLSGILAKITRSPAISAGVLNDAADIIAQEGCIALKTDRVGVWVTTKEMDFLKSVSCYDFSAGKFITQNDFSLSDSKLYKKFLETERLIVTENVRTSDVWADLVDGYQPKLCAVLDVPIRIDGKLAGAVCIEQDCNKKYTKERKWKIEEQNFASSLADLMALAISSTERHTARDAALTANQAKSVFLANMSHEIRTPLNVIIGLADLTLEENHLEKTAFENLQKISNAGSTLLSIVNDILDFSKIESGKLTLMPNEYYISSLLNDVITLMNTRIGEKPIIFRLNINDDLPGKLYGDDLRVKQILNNLLSNAFKYTEAGNIELTVNCIPKDEKDLWMEITVRDTGIGIDRENLVKLFTDYYQVETKASRKMEGTGLGLSITKKLVEMMGGIITAESEPGKGTIFRARIQQGYTDKTPVGPAIADNLRKFRYTDDNRIVSKKLIRPDLSFAKVLVVDDMQTNLDVVAGLLGKYKMQIDCVLSGQEAVERMRLGVPVYNAIFMDHMMPEMDGIETANNIRNLNTEYVKKIPIIALTANAIQGTEEMFYANGFQAFLSKPIDIVQLDSVIRKWIRRQET